MNEKVIPVCAALIFRCGKVLVTSRPADKPYSGYWEFPGGKVEQGESHQDCLIREIQEELGVTVSVDSLFHTLTHDYPEKRVEIFFYHCSLPPDMNPSPRENQQVQWVFPPALRSIGLLPADIPVAEALLSECCR